MSTSTSTAEKIAAPTLTTAAAKQPNIDNDKATANAQQKNCAPREGLIVLNLLGLLANNLFEVGFANQLSQALCWEVVYRPMWNNEFPSQRGNECFPSAQLPEISTELPSTLSLSLLQEIQLNASVWTTMCAKGREESNLAYRAWVEGLGKKGMATQLVHPNYDFKGDAVDCLVNGIRNASSQIQVLGLESFFIHYDWMKPHMTNIRQWFNMSQNCCHHAPPDNAVVIHVREFDPMDSGHNDMTASVYTHILQHYNLTNRPLWIICQPKSIFSPFVQKIAAVSQSSVEIIPGVDQYDAFCTLTRAKTLVLSYISSFSQMAALLSNASEVHYPIPTLDKPRVTLAVPGWKYHLVKEETLDSIAQFNVGYENIVTQIA